jgi:hypothetical protein
LGRRKGEEKKGKKRKKEKGKKGGRSEDAPDLNRLLVVSDDDVDGEMGVDHAHLVGEAVGDTLDHVLDLGADGAEASNVLATSVPDDEADLVDGLEGLLGGNLGADRHGDVLGVLLTGKGEGCAMTMDGATAEEGRRGGGGAQRREKEDQRLIHPNSCGLKDHEPSGECHGDR